MLLAPTHVFTARPKGAGPRQAPQTPTENGKPPAGKVALTVSPAAQKNRSRPNSCYG